MQREPGRGRVGGEGSVGRGSATDVHVTERDVMVLLTNSDWGQIRKRAVYALMHAKKRGYRGHVASVETVPWNLIRLIPA